MSEFRRPAGRVDPPEYAIPRGTPTSDEPARSFRSTRRFVRGSAKFGGLLGGAAALVGSTIYTVDADVTSVLLIVVIMVVGAPVTGFAVVQLRLMNKGRALATTVDDVLALSRSNADLLVRLVMPFHRTPPDAPEPDTPRSDPTRLPPTDRVGHGCGTALSVAPVSCATLPDGPISPETEGRAVLSRAARDVPATDMSGFWPALTSGERDALIACAEPRVFPPGTVLFRAGQLAESVVVVNGGRVDVSVRRAGAEHTIARRGPGEIIGERAVLRRRARSATVTAVGTVQGLLVTAPEFVEFLRRYPRVMEVLERQLYDRMTESSDTPFATDPAGRNCSILLTDITGFGDRARADVDRETMHTAMYEILQDGFAYSGIPWSHCHREDRGDGALIIVPATTSTRAVVEPLITVLAEGLHRYNQQAGPTARISLRAALHVGPVSGNRFGGVSGEAIIHTARLIEARALKKQVSRSRADLGFIVSAFVHDTVIEPGRESSAPVDYRRVAVKVKEHRVAAWMHLFGPPARD